MGCSDFLPPIPPHFVSFAWRYHVGAVRFRVLAFVPLPPGRDADPTGPGIAVPVAPFRLVTWRRQDLPGSWGTPGEHARLFDPGGIGRPRPIAARPMRPSVFVTTSAPALDLISGLDGKACPLAVYASQPRLPNDHARLASGCRPTLPGGIGYPLGPNTRFRAIRYLIAHLLVQAFPGAQQTQRAKTGTGSAVQPS